MEKTDVGEELVKLQIPVSADLAERIAYLANRFERSQAWLTVEALKFALHDRQNFANWMCDMIMGKVNRVFALGNRPLHNPEVVRLQVPVPAALEREIAALGQNLGHTPVRMAGLLIEWLIDGHEIIMIGASSDVAKKVGRWIFAKPKGSGQSAEGSANNTDTSPASSCEQQVAA